jgi:transcriptional regulator with XRE-family HTH domain
MEDAGQKLKRIRERLGLRYRDVEEASVQIAERHNNDEYLLGLSRLADIENKGTVPTLYRLYSLCAIYRLDPLEAMSWYGVNLTALPSDAASIELAATHPIRFSEEGYGDVRLPVALDPGIDIRKTTYLSRMIQRWGRLPLMLLDGIRPEEHRYAYIGADDWFMYPILTPGSLVLIDERKNKIVNSGWTNEFERPIYFLEHRQGYACAWCYQADDQIVLQPHPSSMCLPEVYLVNELDVLGQVSGVAMRLDQAKKRRARAASA